MDDPSDPRLYMHGGRARSANRLAVVVALAITIDLVASLFLPTEWAAGLFLTTLIGGGCYGMVSMLIRDTKQDMETYNSMSVRPPTEPDKTERGASDT